ncbi:hypothetical protein BLNAU_21611 [Blattamonas nauphoetae]|uniref:Protein kinase domain-containing protein n=1 Tax=Blattamonas nauphoetae TaxID=2049346 RepID=A0ABQ9WVG1_9EUKA|nr:hypothetical protein BLNAU_21611 [Blattamonas nauphoetae]
MDHELILFRGAENTTIFTDYKSGSASNLFRMTNSTTKFHQICFNMMKGQDQMSLSHPSNHVLNLVSCAQIANAIFSANKCQFIFDGTTSLFLLTSPSTSESFQVNSVVLSSCLFEVFGYTMRYFCQIDPIAAGPIHNTISITSSHLNDLAIDSPSGLAVSPIKDPRNTITTSLVSLRLNNLTRSERNCCFDVDLKPLTERVTNCVLEGVVDGLEGTVTAPLSTSHSFLCLNSSFSQIMNSAQHEHNTSNFTHVGQTYNADVVSERFNLTHQTTPVIFIGCTITSTNPPKSFIFISMTNHSEDLTISNCTFSVTTTSSIDVRIVYFQPAVGSFPTLIVDKLKGEYSATDSSPNSLSLIHAARSVTAHITGSNFSSQADSKSSRPLQFSGGTFILHIFGCVFSDAMTAGGGGVIAVGNGGELIMSDCLMEGNQVTGNGGCVSIGRQCVSFHRCVMRNNKATRGGVLTSSGLTLGVWEDCAFEANVATEGQHFSGNDMVNNAGLSTYNPELIIGCTSTSASPKISYYTSATSNGVHPHEDIIFPHPSTKSEYDQKLAVDLDGSGTTCSDEMPCQTISSAFTILSPAGRNRILVGTGAFSDSAHALSGSVELVGNGWIRDSSFFTTLTTAGMKVGGGGNITLRSMTLLPSTDTTVVASMDEEGTLRFSFIGIDLISSHATSLVSISKGITTLFRCWFDQVTLANSAFVSVSGSASLNLHGTYFMLIRRENGDGASCIDSESTGAISFETSDFGNCSSSGKAGVLHLKGKDGAGSISFKKTYFYNNEAGQSSLTTNGSLIFANDIILDGIATNQISATSLQSISHQISFIRLGIPVRLSPIAQFGYSADGITFTLAGKYYQGIPISQFSSIKIMTEDTFKYCTSVSPIMPRVTLLLDPLLAEDVDVHWRTAVLQPSTSAETIVKVGQNATFGIREGSLTFVELPTVVPFVVLHSTGLFELRSETWTFTCDTTHISVPLFSVSAGQIRIETCELQAGLSFLGYSMMEATGGTIRLLRTAFKRITTTENGSVVHSTSATVNIDSCSFEECSAKNGGVVWFETSGSHFLQVLHPPTSPFSATFLNCGASEKGGVLCVEGTTSLPNPIRFATNSVNHARFAGSWSGSVGKDVYVGKSVFGSKPTSDILKFGGGSYSDWHHVEIEGRGADEDELKDIGFLIPLPIVSVNGSVKELTTGLSGKDEEACKWTSSFCATLGFGIGILKSKYNGENIEMGVQFVWNMTYTEKPMIVSDQNVVLTGTTAKDLSKSNTTRTIVKMDTSSTAGSPLFTITNHAILSVSNIDFFLKPENGLFAMDPTGDTLKIENCGMIASSGSVSSESVMSVAGGSVWMKDISLNTSATGRSTFASPLIYVNSKAGPIILQSISFSNIAISDSSSIVSIVTQFAVVLTDVTFDDCLVSSNDSHLVFLEGTDFLNQIIPSCWEGSFSSSTSLKDFWGKDSSLSSSEDWKESSLLFYLFPPETVIVLNKDATNPSHHPNCGSVLLSCQSLNSAFSSLRDTIRGVSIESEADLTEKIIVTSSCSFIASSSIHVLKMAETGSTEVNGPGVTLSINKLEIKCLSSSSVSSLFSVMSGTLEMEGCVIGSSSSLSPLRLPSSMTSLVEVGSSGTVSFVASSITHSVFTNPSKGSSLIVQKGGSITLDTSSFISNVLSSGIGSHVLVFGDSFPSIAESEVMQRLKPTLPSSGFFSSEERNRLAGCVDGEVDGILFEWYPANVGEQHVRTGGVNHLKGGHSALPQLTIKFGISQLGSDGSIILDSSLSFGETVAFPDSAIEITTSPVQNDRKEIFVGSGGHFSVEHGHLTLASLSFSTTIPARPVLSASLGSTNTLSIVNTEFSDCSSEMDGGVIALTLSQSTKSSQLEIKASFSSCSCGDTKHGEWIHVAGHNLARQILPSNWEGHPTTFGDENEHTVWGTDLSVTGTFFASYTLLVHLLERKEETIFVNSLGQDAIGCGSTKYPCKTISSSLSHLLNGSSSQLALQNSSVLSSTIENKWNDLQICGTVEEWQDVDVSATGRISVPTLQLSLSFLFFTTSEPSLDHSLVSITGTGSLKVGSCSFSSFRTTGSGSIVSGTLSSSSLLHLTSTSFSTCSASGNGGVISIICDEAVSSSSLILDCSFDALCSCGIDSKGYWVFLDGFGFEDLISAPNWLSVCSSLTSPENDSVLYGIDRKEPVISSFHSLSLLYYLLPFRSSTVFAGSSGRDSNGCGQEERMCRRLETAHSHLSGTADFDLFVVGSASLTTPLIFTPNDLQLRPKSGRETIHVEEEGRFEDGDMAGNHLLSIHRITFNLNTATCSTLFKTGVGQLALTSCSFEKDSPFDLEIMNLVGGEVSIENTTFISASFTRTPFVFSSFTSVEFEKVRFERCSGERFLEASGSGENSKLSFDSCHFSGKVDIVQPHTNSDEICTWSTGMIRLTNTSTTFRSVDFTNGRGGIRQEGGWSYLTNTTFSNLSPSHHLFPSARRNVFCSGNGTVVVYGDSSEGKDLWIGGTDCSINNGTETLLSPFFIPTLDSSQSKSEQNKKKQTFSLLISGTMLIPCGLSLEIVEEKGSTSDPSAVPLLLSESTTTSFNETTITLEVSQSSLEKALNSSLEWSGRLMFGVGMRTADKFRVKVSRIEEKKSQAKQAVSIIVPIAASLLVMLFLLLLILLLVRRHRKKTKESLASQKELDHIEEDGDGIKMDVFGVDLHEKWTGDIIKPDQSTRSGIETFNDETVREASEPSERSCPSDRNGVGGRMVEAMKCDGEFATSVVARTDTLFDRLHSESKKEMNKRAILVELTKALQKLRITLPEAEALTHLSSHWVMFDKDGQMLLQVKREKNKIVQPHHSHHSLQKPILHPPQQVGSFTSSLNLNNSSPHPSQNQPRESFFRLANESDEMSFNLSATQTNDNSPQTSPTTSDRQDAHFENIALRHGFTQPVTQPDFDMPTPQSNPRTDTAFEGLRWQAPEVVGSRVEVDRERAAVFSLGLIMWEVETEAVPFGEMDAVNAARQNETGCLPRMNLISDPKERDLIQQCLQTDPSSRPSLSSLLSTLSELPLTSSVVHKNDPHIS